MAKGSKRSGNIVGKKNSNQKRNSSAKGKKTTPKRKRLHLSLKSKNIKKKKTDVVVRHSDDESPSTSEDNLVRNTNCGYCGRMVHEQIN